MSFSLRDDQIPISAGPHSAAVVEGLCGRRTLRSNIQAPPMSNEAIYVLTYEDGGFTVYSLGLAPATLNYINGTRLGRKRQPHLKSWTVTHPGTEHAERRLRSGGRTMTDVFKATCDNGCQVVLDIG